MDANEGESQNKRGEIIQQSFHINSHFGAQHRFRLARFVSWMFSSSNKDGSRRGVFPQAIVSE